MANRSSRLLAAGADSPSSRSCQRSRSPRLRRRSVRGRRRVEARGRSHSRAADGVRRAGARRRRTLLVDLRKLEVDRELKSEELASAERELRRTREKVAATSARAAALQNTRRYRTARCRAARSSISTSSDAPGYWRLLLDVDNLRSIGRVYRTASALNRLDRERVQQHERTSAGAGQERASARSARHEMLTRLQEQAVAAQGRSSTGPSRRERRSCASIDERRDLNAQLDRRARSRAAAAAGHRRAARRPRRQRRHAAAARRSEVRSRGRRRGWSSAGSGGRQPADLAPPSPAAASRSPWPKVSRCAPFTREPWPLPISSPATATSSSSTTATARTRSMAICRRSRSPGEPIWTCRHQVGNLGARPERQPGPLFRASDRRQTGRSLTMA